MPGEAPSTYVLGPGEITIGEVGTAVDFTAQLTGGTVTWDKEKEDDVPVLSGGVLAGDTTYTAKISGNVFQDLGDAGGLVEFSWTNKGAQFPFSYTPATAVGRSITGVVTIDPIDVGGDEMKKRPQSDFEWDFVGEPELSAMVAPLMGLSAGVSSDPDLT